METSPPVPGSHATPTCNWRRGAQDGVPTPTGCPAAHAAPVMCKKEGGTGEVGPPSCLGECPGTAGTTCGLRVRGPARSHGDHAATSGSHVAPSRVSPLCARGGEGPVPMTLTLAWGHREGEGGTPWRRATRERGRMLSLHPCGSPPGT